MKNLHCYEFSGFGNYSDYHNWDNGLSSNLSKNPISHFDCIIQYAEYGVKHPFDKGVYCHINTYGGSRNAHGVVIASSKTEAEYMLKIFDRSFPVVEYIPQ
jgi:hypothetical protein